MKNNWKEEFESKCESGHFKIGEIDKSLLVKFITSLLTEQKKELMEKILNKGEDNGNCYEGCYRDWVTKIESLKHYD